MTTAETQHARPGRFGQAWRGFRRWRRARPFWGGLFTALAGLEIFGTTQMSLGGLSFQMGPTGFLSWLIPAILFTCGLLMWFSPQQRLFYAVVAAVTAVYSLIGVNLGGFFIGLLFGMVGSALGFAWVPDRTPPAAVLAFGKPVEEARPADDEDLEEGEPALVDDLMPRQREDEATGPLTDTLPQPRNPLRERSPAEPESRLDDSTQVLPTVQPEGGGAPGSAHRDPKLYAILLVVASVSMAGLLGLRGEQPAFAAAPVCPTPTSAAPSPTASASASPAAAPKQQASAGNVLTDIIDDITDLFTGGDESGTDGTTATASPTPDPSTTAGPAAAEPTPTDPAAIDPSTSADPTPTESTTTTAAPSPSSSGTAQPSGPVKPSPEASSSCATPAPIKPKPVEAGKLLPRLAAEPGQERVAARPSKLTGSKVTMTGLRFAGVVELETGDGKLRALKFTMDKAVTDDFVLQADGPGSKIVRYATDQLTVKGDVAFYATRFVGRLLGIEITLTPDLPFPDGIPITSPLPITFTDPVIDLAYVNCDTLTAKPTLKLDLA